MVKILLTTLLPIMACLSSTVASAQSFFGTQNSYNSSGATTPAGTSRMSKDDFNNAVNALSQQNQNALSQKTRQQLPPPATSAQGTVPSTPQTGTTMAPSNYPSASTPTTTMPQPTSSYASPNYGTTANPSTSTPSSFSSTTSQPSNGGRVYSGFQGSTSAPANTNKSNNTSPGWNIKY